MPAPSDPANAVKSSHNRGRRRGLSHGMASPGAPSLHVELDRQLRAAGRRGPGRRGVRPIVRGAGGRDSHRSLVQRRHTRRLHDRRLLLESSRFINADVYRDGVGWASGVVLVPKRPLSAPTLPRGIRMPGWSAMTGCWMSMLAFQPHCLDWPTRRQSAATNRSDRRRRAWLRARSEVLRHSPSLRNQGHPNPKAT